MKITFEHLHDDKWGKICKSKNKWENPMILSPNGFIPEKGKEYSCNLCPTNATFVYNNIFYDVVSVYLKDNSDILVETLHIKKEMLK